MLEYWKDGRKVQCLPISQNGRVGQSVILDNVGFGAEADVSRYPLAAYSQPCHFTIVEKVDGRNGYYVLKDARENLVTVRSEVFGASSDSLYDASEWLAWRTAYEKEKCERKDRKIAILQGHLDVLKDILVRQGVRLISEKEAKEIGLGERPVVVYLVQEKK